MKKIIIFYLVLATIAVFMVNLMIDLYLLEVICQTLFIVVLTAIYIRNGKMIKETFYNDVYNISEDIYFFSSIGLYFIYIVLLANQWIVFFTDTNVLRISENLISNTIKIITVLLYIIFALYYAIKKTCTR